MAVAIVHSLTMSTRTTARFNQKRVTFSSGTKGAASSRHARISARAILEQRSRRDTDQRSLRNIASVLVSMAAALILSPAAAHADGPPPLTPEPAAFYGSQVPAAVNTVNTEENAVVERQKEADESSQQGSESSKTQEASVSAPSENPPQEEKQSSSEATRETKVSLELTTDGKPAGSIVIRTFQDPPLGTQRFLDLAERRAGGYRLSKVNGISDAFVTISGVLQLNYSGLPPITGGETVEQLQAEQRVFPRSHDRAGLVSLIVEDAIPKDVRDRMVAYQGKLIKVEEVKGAGNANGTGLAITLDSAPELDRTNLVIGEVVEGLDVVDTISKLPKVKSSSESPFFKVAKALGDRRADVAARSFGKPLGRVIVQKVEVTSR